MDFILDEDSFVKFIEDVLCIFKGGVMFVKVDKYFSNVVSNWGWMSGCECIDFVINYKDEIFVIVWKEGWI